MHKNIYPFTEKSFLFFFAFLHFTHLGFNDIVEPVTIFQEPTKHVARYGCRNYCVLIDIFVDLDKIFAMNH